MAQTAGAELQFRAEVIGSLLRPRSLKEAGQQAAQSTLPAEAHEALLDREVARIIDQQERLGFKAVTDGEFARTSWFGFFFENIDGFSLAPSLFKFRDAQGRLFEWPTCVAAKRIRRQGSITLPEFTRARRHTQTAMVKAIMPAPSAFHFFRLAAAVEPGAYSDISVFFDDLVAIYQAEITELGRAGCRYVQFDEVPMAMLCDADVRRQGAAAGSDPATLLETYIGLIKRILAVKPAGMTIGMHLCRGNFRSRWMAAGGYEPIADRLFNDTPVDVFLLEYDTERAGDFAPLRYMPRGKRAVLGLVSSKAAQLEDQPELLQRIDMAAKVVPLDQLALSTQCGFASVAGGNTLSEAEQWSKLALVARTAEQVWGTT